jgi:RHS repeat-associated protein
LINTTGTLDQPYQFSTKRYDADTGLNYYGFRFYAPVIERWLNRDPLGEDRGINLYGFVYNDPVNFVDPWGLKCVGPSGYHYVGLSHRANSNVHSTFTFKISCESGKKLCGTPTLNKDEMAEKAPNSSEILTRPTSFSILSMTETEVVVEVETRIIIQPSALGFLLRNLKLCYECCCE